MADLRSVLSGFDLDSGAGTELIHGVTLRLSASGGSIEAIGQQLMAASIPVVLASNQSSIAVDTEMGPAAALTDNFANPTVGGVAAFNMVWDGSTWDRAPGSSADGALVNLGANNDVTITGTVTVDSELVAVAALADAVANPTVTSLGAYMLGFNGTTWDRVRTANTGRLQVDVITGGGTDSPTAPLSDYVTSAAVAAGAEVNLDSAESAAKKLAQVTVWSSVAYRARVFLVNNGVEATEALAVGGGNAFTGWTWEPPHRNYAALGTTAGADTFRVEFISMDDANAADAHAVFLYES
jgi:hypothetical protein